MKKIITLVLAIALLMTSVMAIAEVHATPNINTFAKMTVKYNEGNRLYTITLDKAVDRLLIKWADAEPEELAVDENLEATAIAWGHKYMPGTTQYYATWSQNGGTIELDETWLGWSIVDGTDVYVLDDEPLEDNSLYYDDDTCTFGAPFAEVTELGPKRIIYPIDYTTNGKFDQSKWDKVIKAYKAQYPQYKNYEIVEPTTLNSNGYIQGSRVFNRINKAFQTVIATPDQTAYMTVQDEWAVYYNRAGKIVGIEYFDGQF